MNDTETIKTERINLIKELTGQDSVKLEQLDALENLIAKQANPEAYKDSRVVGYTPKTDDNIILVNLIKEKGRDLIKMIRLLDIANKSLAEQQTREHSGGSTIISVTGEQAAESTGLTVEQVEAWRRWFEKVQKDGTGPVSAKWTNMGAFSVQTGIMQACRGIFLPDDDL